VLTYLSGAMARPFLGPARAAPSSAEKSMRRSIASTTPARRPRSSGRLSTALLGAACAAAAVCAVPSRAPAQLSAGGQTIGGPGIVELKQAKSGESMATVLVSENPLTMCATVRPVSGVVAGIYLGAGDEEAHFDIAPSGDVVSRTATVCRPKAVWVSVHCRGACVFEWRVDELR
jgi:hypothetical protein